MKYSFKDRCNVVAKYIDQHKPYNQIARETDIDKMEIKNWIRLYKRYGTNSLKPRNNHYQYSLNFKVDVIRYYQNHNVGAGPVGAYFNISPSRILKWTKILNSYGIKALVPIKERRKLMKSKHKNKSLSSKDRRIRALEKQVHHYKLGYLALKYLAQRK